MYLIDCIFLLISTLCTLLTNSSRLQIDSWKTIFLLGRSIFTGELLVSAPLPLQEKVQKTLSSFYIIYIMVGSLETSKNIIFCFLCFPPRNSRRILPNTLTPLTLRRELSARRWVGWVNWRWGWVKPWGNFCWYCWLKKSWTSWGW